MRRVIRIIAGVCAFLLGAACAGIGAVVVMRAVPDLRGMAEARHSVFLAGVLGLAMLCGGGLGAWWIAADPERRREARSENGQCLACGYCLTGNVSGVCPECGTVLDEADWAAP
jgi:hypothetical protein